MRKPVFRLKQQKDGQWQCRTSRLPKSYTEGLDPNQAVAKMEHALSCFDEFLDHNYGHCGEGCSYCKEGRERGKWAEALKSAGLADEIPVKRT